ncbi:hypothetical protein C3L33_05059, partial [Rhododendron williamsianum]
MSLIYNPFLITCRTMIQNMIKDGKIVPSEVTIKLLQRAMLESSNDKFLIDGFPRNEENRAVFESVTGIEPEFVLFLDCPKEEMERRLLGRNQGREDDNIDTIRKRFKVYMESSLPVIEYYNSKGKVRKIDAAKTVEEVFEAVKAVFTKVKHHSNAPRSSKLPRCCTSLGNFFAAYYDTTISGVFRARPVRGLGVVAGVEKTVVVVSGGGMVAGLVQPGGFSAAFF